MAANFGVWSENIDNFKNKLHNCRNKITKQEKLSDIYGLRSKKTVHLWSILQKCMVHV